MVSEKATAQTDSAVQADTRWQNGVVGHQVVIVSNDREVTKYVFNRMVLERLAKVGDSPVDEKNIPSFWCSQVARSTWNSV